MAIGLENNNKHFCSSVCKFGATIYIQRPQMGEGKGGCYYSRAPSISGITMSSKFLCGQGPKSQQQVFSLCRSHSLCCVFRVAMTLFSVRSHWDANLSQPLEAAQVGARTGIEKKALRTSKNTGCW